jgi:hypothetical protein
MRGATKGTATNASHTYENLELAGGAGVGPTELIDSLFCTNLGY